MFMFNGESTRTVCKSSLQGISRKIGGMVTFPPMHRPTRLHLVKDLEAAIYCTYSSDECYVVRYWNSEEYIVTRNYSTACLAGRGVDSTIIHVWREATSEDGIFYHATVMG